MGYKSIYVYKKLSSNTSFAKIVAVSYNFLKGINEFLPVLAIFLDCCGANLAFLSYTKIGALGIHEILSLFSTFLSNLDKI
jgi:hypothetical protein